MVSKRKRNTKSGNYAICGTYKGIRFHISTKTSDEKAAEQIRQTTEARIALGTFNIKDYQNDSPFLYEAKEEYLEDVKDDKSPNTIINERHYLKELCKFLQNRKTFSISDRDIKKWRQHRLRTISRTTANIERRTLHKFFNWCIEKEYIKNNPVSKLPKLTIEEKNRLYFTDNELRELMALIDKTRLSARGSRDKRFMEEFQLFIMFLLFTGLRRGEALALRWSDIILEQGIAHVYQPKVKKTRVVPLHPIVISILKKLGPNLFKELNGNHVSRKFQHFLVLAGLKGFKLHSLRHTFASNLTQMGTNILAVKELLGHSDIRTTMIYAKTNIESLQREVLKIKRELPPSDILTTKEGDDTNKVEITT